MPVYQITAPDGRKLRVTAPEGATQEDALAYAQQQLGQQPAESRQQKYERLLAEFEARQPSGSSDPAVVARQTFDESPWYAKPFIAAGAEFNRLGRGAQQIYASTADKIAPRQVSMSDLVTGRNTSRAAEVQTRVDADAPFQDGVHGVSGFIGRALPYLATLPLGGPEAAVLGRAGNVGRLGQLAIKGGTAAAEGAAYGALGETRTGESRLANAGYGAAGGVAGRSIAGGLGAAGKALSRKADPILQADVQTAVREGIPLHISQVSQSIPAKTAASMAKYLPFSGAGKAARNQQDAWNSALTGHAGDATTRLDDVWLANRAKAFGDAYDQIWSRNDVTISPQAAAKMQQVVKDAYRDLGTDGGKVVENQFNRILDDVARANQGGTISGRNYQTLASDLASVQPGTSVGNFVSRIRKDLVGAADESVNPADMALKRQIDQQYNNFMTLKKLLTRPAGAKADISPAALWSAVNARGPKATKEFRDLAKVGQNLLKDPIPDSGSIGRLVSAGLLGGGGSLAGGVLPAAGMIVGGATVGRALNSPAIGRLASRNAGKANGIAKLLEADGKVGAIRRGAGRGATKATVANSPRDQALQLEISGGTPVSLAEYQRIIEAERKRGR